MSWITIFKKELKDSLSKGLIIGLLCLVIIIWLISLVLVNSNISIGNNKIKIGLIDLDNTNLSNEVCNILSYESNLVYLDNKSFEGAIENTKKGDGIAVLVIEKGFSNNILNNSMGNIRIYWIIKTYGVIDATESTKMMLLLDNLRQNMSKVLIPEDSLVNATIIMNSFEINETTILKGETFENTSVSEATDYVMFLQMILPMVMLIFAMILGANIVTSITKERGCDMLETLLSFPVKRRDILIGKILASIVSIFVIVLILQSGGSMIAGSITSDASNSSNSGGIRLDLSVIDYFLLVIIMLAGLLCSVSLYTLSAMFTSTNRKSFLSSFPTIFLFVIPTAILIMYDFSTLSLTSKIYLGIIPGSHMSIAINSIINNNYPLVIASITYLVLFSFLVFSLVIKLFKTDRVIS